MSLQRARSIDDISGRVSGADIVLSAEAPLTLALDRRADSPRIGRIAATPRSHASGELVPTDRRPLFFDLIETTDLPWKTAGRALDLCLDCWNRTGRRDAILEYPEFDTAAIRTTLERLGEVESSYRDLATTQLSEETDVRVIDADALTSLDRSLLPNDYETVDPFAGSTAVFPTVHLYLSATAIVETVVDQLAAETADQVAIVLDQGSPYSSLVEAALEAAAIPYQGGPGFIDNDDVRLLLRILQTCFAGSGVTAAEVRPLLTAAGVEVPRDFDEKRVDIAAASADHPAFAALEDLRTTALDGTFDAAVSAFEDLVGTRLTSLRNELDALGLTDAAITERRVNELVYYFQSFEIPIERESDGVLLADASSTAYVDRPVVFYLGLGEGWARTPPDYPWVDTPTFIEQDLRRFQLLLQNGAQRYVLAQESRAGDAVTLCPYLHDVFGERDLDGFDDLPDVVRHEGGLATPAQQDFPTPAIAPTPDPIDTVSQSTLKDLANAPRDHYFDELLASPTNYAMERGNVLHEAAEIYVNDPAYFTTERTRLLDAMCDRVAPYLPDARLETIRTRLDVGLTVIEAYLDTHPPTEHPHDTYDGPLHDNELAEALDIDLEATICEVWFATGDLGGHGVVDLLRDARTLVDYKTGRPKSASDVHDRTAIEDVHEYPDFQAALYLCQHRRENPDERLEMDFVYLLGAVDEIVKGAAPDLADLVTTVTYLPCTFETYVTRREVFDDLTDYAETNDRRKVLDKLGYDTYRAFFEAHPLPREGAEPDQRARVREAFREMAEAEIGAYQYVADGTELIFGDLTEPAGCFLADDLDAFEEFLQERLADLREYTRTRFPVAFGDEPNWDRVSHRDIILTDQ